MHPTSSRTSKPVSKRKTCEILLSSSIYLCSMPDSWCSVGVNSFRKPLCKTTSKERNVPVNSFEDFSARRRSKLLPYLCSVLYMSTWYSFNSTVQNISSKYS